MHEHFRRHKKNPLISREDIPWGASAVLNPAAVEHDGQTVLLLRLEDERGISNIHVARSRDGISDWSVEEEPLIAHGLPGMRYETQGCEDARATYLEEDGCFYICYVAYSELGPAVGIGRTRDFKSFERIGLVFGPNNKDAVLFPKKFGKHYMLLHRPEAGDAEHVWSARSPDLIHWGEPHCVLPERSGPYWDNLKVGSGPPPILTDEGWLLIYHGVKAYGGNLVYRVGLALLDKAEPHKVKARTPGWVFGAEADYETRGLAPNVVFPSGCVVHGDELRIYYGAADSCVALVTADLEEVLHHVKSTAHQTQSQREWQHQASS